MEREIWEIVKTLDKKKLTAIEAHKKLCAIHDVNVSLLCEFANYILHNANWSESFADKPWYSEILERNVSSKELAESFLNSR